VGVYLEVCFIYYYDDGYVFILGRIWGYVYLQRYHSFVKFVYLSYIC
jgi:hypothetical protein